MLFKQTIYKTPIILQYAETECGLACLASIFSYYHLSLPLSQLRDESGLSRDGTRATTLLSIAKRHGFEADAYSMEIPALENLSEPVILHWNFSHYVILEGIQGDRVYINDPAIGRLSITRRMLDESFTGVVLAIRPLEPIKPNVTHVRENLFLSFFKLTLPFQGYQFFALVLMGLLPLIISGLGAVMVNHVLLRNQSQWLWPVLGMFTFFSLLLISITVIQQWLQQQYSESLSLSVSSKLFVQVLQWPAKLFELRPKGELLSVLSQLDYSISNLLNGIARFGANILMSLILLLSLFMLNYVLAIVSLSIIALFTLLTYCLSTKKKRQEKLSVFAEGQWYAATLSAFNHVESVMISGLETLVFADWCRALHQKITQQQSVMHYHVLLTGINRCLQTVIPLLFFVLVLHEYEQGHLNLGSLFALTTLNTLFIRQISIVLDQLNMMQTVSAELNRVEDVQSVKQDPRFLLMHQPVLSTAPYALCLDEVSFHYNQTSAPVIHRLSLHIKPGQHVAFVGESGSGKSTLVKLLSGLYTPDEGKLSINGQTLTEIPANQLATLIAVVSQEAGLLSGTLLDNLTLWNNDVLMESVHLALQTVELEKLVESRGLMFEVTNDVMISGGERQRIELARALIQNTPVLILDEATSALDVAMESRILSRLRKLDKTIIHIAHRLSTIQHCDQIFVLAAGSVQEHGTHHRLMQKKGLYYQLVHVEATKGSALDDVA